MEKFPKSIVYMNLSNCNISDDAGEVLVKSFVSNYVCQKLNLACNSFGLNTSRAFEKVLTENVTLKTLDLSHNAFYEDFAIVNVLEGLRTNESLEYLDLSWNALCGEAFGKILSKAVKSSKLKILKFENNRMTKFELKKLAVGLKFSKTIKEVYIKGNSFGEDDDVTMINVFTSKSPLEMMSFGKWFHLSQDAFKVSLNFFRVSST